MSDTYKFSLTIGVLCMVAGMSEWVSRQVWESVYAILVFIF